MMLKNAHECTRIYRVQECVGMHQKTPGTTHTYTREAERTQGQTHMDGYGLDGLWACHKACQWRTHVPLHVIQVFIFRLLSIPFLFDRVVSRLDAGPATMMCATRTAQSRRNPSPSSRPSGVASGRCTSSHLASSPLACWSTCTRVILAPLGSFPCAARACMASICRSIGLTLVSSRT